jgi:hypothetical protein
MAKPAAGAKPTKGAPFVPVSVITRLLAEPIQQHGIAEVARRAKVTTRMIWGWRHGESSWVTFAVTDRIIIHVLDEPALWYLDPDLAAAYQEIA